MNLLRRLTLVTLTLVLILAAWAEPVRGFVVFGSRWPSGAAVVMHMQLAGGVGLTDGSASYNEAAATALSTWNTYLNRIQFAAVQDSTAARADGDNVNNVWFDTSYHGIPIPAGTVAVTTRWEIASTNERTEADVVFNTAFAWDSYRGRNRSVPQDIVRVALHEFGHALGLDHPNAAGQSVSAVMNDRITDLDALTEDDISGAVSLYGPNITSNVSFPPRNEPYDFYNNLNGLYQTELRSGTSGTYVDAEGTVIWVTEYARQRVGQCAHEVATQNTIDQIRGIGSTLTCNLTPRGPIPFPPRDQTVRFMDSLEDTYRTVLGMSQETTFVNNEGAVVWILEYLRYRLNNCNHADAQLKVFQQIRGLGIQPTCTA